MGGDKYRVRPLWIIGLMAPISVAAVFVVIYASGDFARLPSVLSQTNWLWFSVVPPCVAAFYVLHSIRIRCALADAAKSAPGDARLPGVRSLAGCMLTGHVVNTMLPGMGGELVTAYFARKKHSLPMPDYLAASAFTKVVALATNVALAFLGLMLMPPGEEAAGGSEVLANLFNVALGALVAAIALALMFPGLVKWGAHVARWLFRIPSDPEPGFKRLVKRMSDGLDRTADLFRTLRGAGVWPVVRTVLVTVVINATVAVSMAVGFIAVGFWPQFYQVLLFFSVLTVVRVAAMVLLAVIGVAEVTALAYWTQITGLAPSQILVAYLAVKLWEVVEGGVSTYLFVRNASTVTKQELAALLKGETP